MATISRETGSDRSRDVVLLLAIVTTALVLRIVYITQFRSCPLYGHETLDPKFWDEWARAFAEGRRYVAAPYYRAPLYAWFLGSVYWLFGTAPMVPRLVQAVLGSLSCGLMFLIGRRTFSRPVGIVAGFSAATYWILIHFDGELLMSALVVFLDLVLLWLLLYAGDRRSWGLWLLSGAVLGLSAIARPNIILFAPAVLVWIAVLHRHAWRRILLYAVSFAAGCAAPILPVTIRNYAVGRDFVLIASQGGVNFCIGNNPSCKGNVNAPFDISPDEWREGQSAQAKIAERTAGRKLKDSEVSDWYLEQSLSWMRRHRGDEAALTLKKLGIFWSRWEASDNKDIYYVTSRYTPIVRFLPLGFWIVGPLGLLGWMLSLGQAKRLFPLWGFAAVYMISVVIFIPLARYRVPVVVALILLGSHAACRMVQVLRARRWREAGLALVVLGLISPLVARIPEDADVDMASGRRAVGIALAQQGRLEEAENLLTEVVALRPASAIGWRRLGEVRMQRGKWAEAELAFRRALAVDPQCPGARNQLGVALGAQGRLDQAVEQFTLALSSQPDPEGQVRANLGSALVQLRDVDKGLTYLTDACAVNAANSGMLIATAEAVGRQGRHADQILILRTAAARFSADAAILSALAMALATCPDAALRDSAQAVQVAERACELTKGQDVAALDAASAAYFAAGQVEKAASFGRRAAELARRQDSPDVAARIEQRLRDYAPRSG